MMIQNLVLAMTATIVAVTQAGLNDLGLYLIVMFILLNMICLPVKLILKLTMRK